MMVEVLRPFVPSVVALQLNTYRNLDAFTSAHRSTAANIGQTKNIVVNFIVAHL